MQGKAGKDSVASISIATVLPLLTITINIS